MGLFIHLTVNSHNIAPEQWEETYQESLLLLKRFPAPLMRLHREEIHGQKRYMLTTNIIKEKDTQDEHWEIDGDLLSYQRAETFQLYRHLKQWLPNKDDKEVLWADEDSLDYVEGNGVDIFGYKTQGYPYHLAVLAVAILFESRFPNNIYLIGDIDRTQVESVITWMNRILATPVTVPVCLDGKSLYTRLDSLYDDSSLAIRRFKTLYRDTDKEQLETLLRYGNRTLVLQEWTEELRYYSSLSQLGVIKLISQFLSVTQDIRQLIEIVIEAGKTQSESEFTLEELLRVLGNKFITIEEKEREPLDLFVRSSETLMDITSAFAEVFMTLGGAPSFIDFYIARSELLEIFSSYDPAKRDTFNQILEACEKKCQEELAQTKTLIGELEKSEEQETSEDAEAEVGTSGLAIPQSETETIAHEEEYIVKQFQHHKKEYKHPDQAAKKIGIQLQQIIREISDVFGVGVDREYYLAGIYKATYQNGLALRESTWLQIDQEQNIQILKSLLAFSFISERESSFWDWRIYILEHSELWHYLIDE